MRSLKLMCLALPLMLLGSGCHCCRSTECFADRIDDFADHKDFDRKLDGLYCEETDATRWCMNCRCGHCCCPQCAVPQYRSGK